MNFFLWAIITVMQQHQGCTVHIYAEEDHLVARHGEVTYRIDQCNERTAAYLHDWLLRCHQDAR